MRRMTKASNQFQGIVKDTSLKVNSQNQVFDGNAIKMTLKFNATLLFSDTLVLNLYIYYNIIYEI